LNSSDQNKTPRNSTKSKNFGDELTPFFEDFEGDEISDLFGPCLIDPLDDFFENTGKGFRRALVEIGFQMGSARSIEDFTTSEKKLCSEGCEILEMLHAGSLIVDDIEDESTDRRGMPALHMRYGLPIALNAGNLLYFLPFQKLSRMVSDPKLELKLYKQMHRTLFWAHMGQSLDLGTRIDAIEQARVEKVCRKVMALKTGTLVALALELGATLGGMETTGLNKLHRLGMEFGSCLQMFDDIGNCTPSDQNLKLFEDIGKLKPSWVFAVGSKEMRTAHFKEWLDLIRESDESSHDLSGREQLISFIEKHGILESSKDRAKEELERVLQGVGLVFNAHGFVVKQWSELGRQMEKSYD
jgi:geranylgeranyl pyrophosphate synthase